MAEGQEVAIRKYEDVRKWFSDPRVQHQLSLVIPAHLNMNKLLNDAFQVIKNNDYLLECSKRSLIAGIMAMAELGLSARKELGQAHLVPFKNRKSGETEATLIIGYRGYIVLAKNTGEISKVSAHAVYSNDKFELQYGTDEYLRHELAEGDKGEFKGAYCVFFYKDGTTSFEYMKKERIDAVRNRAKAKDEGPWVTDYEDMAIKTVIRHHAKYAPLSTEKMVRAAELEERYLEGLPQTDLLPEVGEQPSSGEIPTPTMAPSPEASKFDVLVSEWTKKEYPGGLPADAVKSFLDFLAQKNNVTVDALKTDAANRWGAFSVALKKYLDTKAVKPPTEETKPATESQPRRGRPPKEVAKPSTQESPESQPVQGQPSLLNDGAKEKTITCHNTDLSVPLSQCGVCPDREGCPSHD